jgi:hypothetical protein
LLYGVTLEMGERIFELEYFLTALKELSINVTA